MTNVFGEVHGRAGVVAADGRRELRGPSRLSQAGCTTEIGALGISIIEERGAVSTGDSNDDS